MPEINYVILADLFIKGDSEKKKEKVSSGLNTETNSHSRVVLIIKIYLIQMHEMVKIQTNCR